MRITQVIEEGGDDGLLLVAAHHQLQPVGARQSVGGEGGGIPAPAHRDQGLAGVVGRQDVADLPGGGLAPQIAVVELDGGSHALVVVVHHGAEHRGLLQPGHLLHLL